MSSMNQRFKHMKGEKTQSSYNLKMSSLRKTEHTEDTKHTMKYFKMEKNEFLHGNKINNEILISKINKNKICVLGIQLNCKAVASTDKAVGGKTCLSVHIGTVGSLTSLE